MADDRSNTMDNQTDQNVELASIRQPQMLPQVPQPSEADLTPPALSGGGPSVKDVSLSPPAAPQEAKPSMWKSILQGALVGLAGGAGQTSFGGGLGGGARASLQYQQQQKENALEQQKFESEKTFRDMQSAINAAHLAHEGTQIDLETERQKLDRDKFVMDLMKFGRASGKDYDVFPRDSEAAINHLRSRQAGSPDGLADVPAAVLQGGTIIAVPKPMDPNTKYARAARLGSVFGLYVPSKESFLTLPPDKQDKLLAPMENQMAGKKQNGEIMSASDVRAQYRLFESALARYRNSPNHDEATDEEAQVVLNRLKVQMDEHKVEAGEKQRDKVEVAKVGREAGANARVVGVVDNDGNVVMMHAGDAVATGAAPAAQGVKAMSQATQLQEMQVASRNLRGVVNKMQPFSAGQLMQVKAALSESSPGMVADTLKAKLANQQLSPEQQDFVVWAGQMQERAMALRSASGIGQQGSDKLRAAIVATLPNEKDTPELMKKKLNAFDNQVSILMRGIPGVGRGGKNKTAGAAPAAPAAQPQPSGGMVTMKAPNGATKQVPADQVDHFKSLGATVVK